MDDIKLSLKNAEAVAQDRDLAVDPCKYGSESFDWATSGFWKRTLLIGIT